METNSKEVLDLINQTIGDTKYVLDDAKPYKGILRVLIFWILLYTVASIIFYILNEINTNYELYNTNWYYPLYRISNIIIFTSLPIIYFIKTKKTTMTLKEKNFLHNWIIIPILLSICRMLFPIAYYLNAEIMLQLYSTLPFDLCINIIGLFILYKYFKTTCLKILLVINSIYVVFSTIWLSYFMNNLNVTDIEITIMQIVTTLQSNGVIIIVSIITFILLYRRLQHG